MTAHNRDADLIIRNGRIRTMNRAAPWASTVAIRSGRIVAVGEESAIGGLVGKSTKIIDLRGAMAMPGMVDIHNHMMMGGQTDLYELRFPPGLSITEIAARVRAEAENTPPGRWIIGGQWGSDIVSQLNSAAAFAELDAACLSHPVMLRDDSYHNRWASSEAMKRSGITPDRPNPEKGEIGRDPATGALTGLLIESASGLVERTIAESGHYTAEMDRAALARSISTLNSFGVTAFLDAATMLPVLTALKGLDERGELTAWAATCLPVVEPSFMFGLAGDELIAQRDQFRSVHVKPDFAKVFLDGVPAARTAAFHEAYLEDAARRCCFRGTTLMTVPDLVRWIGKCEKLGIAVKIHCAGDAAVTQTLDAVDVVRSFNGPTKLVHHIAHASYIQPSDIARFAELGVAADLSPNIWYPTVFLEGHKMTMGEERALRFWPNKDLKQAGALMAGGSDWPVMPNPDPWAGIEGLVTRQNPTGAYPGEALWPEQALDLETVLEIYSINGARVIGLAGMIGSLEVGKSADIIVLDRNLFDIPANDLADTKVSATFFEGRVIYEHGESARIPVTVLTGFLGSGKTTLLNHLLKLPECGGTLALINEFGEVGLDHLFIETGQERLMVLENGCVCCTIRGDLAETLRTIELQTRQNAFDRIVIETTGLADPVPILHTLMTDPALFSRFRIGGVVATVDAVNGARTLDAYPEALKQIAAADHILITKSDLAEGPAVEALRARLHTVNQIARVAVADHGVAMFESIFNGDDADAASWLDKVETLIAQSEASHCDHVGCNSTHHDHRHLHGRYETMAFVVDQPVDWAAFSQWLDYLTALQGENLLRFKGIVCTTQDPGRPTVVHGVQHILHPPTIMSAWPTEDRRTRLVFIAKGLPRSVIERTLAKFGAAQVTRAVAA